MTTKVRWREKIGAHAWGRLLRLRPPYPPVALEIDRGEAVLVRLRRLRRGKPQLEAHQVRPLPASCLPDSIFHSVPGPESELLPKMQELFETSGTRPGRVSLVLPDNLAKISLLQIPERPGTRRQLDELIRSKMRRAVPFRIEDAQLAYDELGSSGRGLRVVVVLTRRALIERYERALESCGARVGLVDICTPNLLNLCRQRIGEAAASDGDVALLNCARSYFSLVILREGRVIFFRCKTYAPEQGGEMLANGMLVREVASSISYYSERLAGAGLGTLLVRSVDVEPGEVVARLQTLALPRVEAVRPGGLVTPADEGQIDARLAQRLAPALGAAVGRGA